MTDFQDLTEKILEFRKSRGWVKQHVPKNMAISLLLEAAEFLEIFQWTKDNQIPQKKRKELEEELVDVLYWVLLIVHDFEIDIPKAFERKMKQNKKKYPIRRLSTKVFNNNR